MSQLRDSDFRAALERAREEWEREESDWLKRQDELEREADALRAQLSASEAKRRRLREALQEYVDACGRCSGRGIYKEVTPCETRWDARCPDCQDARAALAADEKETP